ncbi:unnamed protein product [Tilletia controversa]|uniref:Yeast cell wall synthesis Kre9/Knh1-like N-terminal domain-containing protein n=1 Tax=Tilletia controversa TaxID=13291 RepID=A0A8X7MWZ7_9BASI|nr:hypothetical protein CF328_g1880 [Tilletia controversa]KAE8252517.1 hypothetical protein A4X06_0g2136 [Tilletia controversa]CAD6916359.1 unnamed protein product [Tilletia controversa]CAD6916855.1 unnamed protein product [Tilletia controversa]CAD6976896.1 unnamed protein product [Tilletia controversa]
MQHLKLTLAAAVLALTAQSALANIVVHSPVAATKAKGGEALDVNWVDDGKVPTTKQYGDINVFLCTGSSQVQYRLQELKGGVKNTKTSGSWKIDPTAGPNSDKYFIRFEGTNVAANGSAPLAFSARFTLSGMTGTWNSTITNTNKGAADIPSAAAPPTGLSTIVSSASVAKATTPSVAPTLKPASSSNQKSAAGPGARMATGAPLAIASLGLGASLVLGMMVL